MRIPHASMFCAKSMLREFFSIEVLMLVFSPKHLWLFLVMDAIPMLGAAPPEHNAAALLPPSVWSFIHLLVLSTHQGYHLDIGSNFVFQEYLFRPEVFPALAFLIHSASADVLTMFRQWVFSTSAVCLRLCVTTKKESEGGAECLRGLWRTWGERNTEVKILWTEHCLCGRKIERWSPVYQICKSVGYNAPWKSFKMKHSVTIMFIPQSLKVWGVTSQVPRCSFKSGREPG